MTPSDEACRWLQQAQEELCDAEDLRGRGRFYLSLFLCQQAAEKALKAFLHARTSSQTVLRMHSVYELGKMAAELDPAFAAVGDAGKLDTYYIPTRYPNGLPGGVPALYYSDPAEAARAVELAQGVLSLVESRLKA